MPVSYTGGSNDMNVCGVFISCSFIIFYSFHSRHNSMDFILPSSNADKWHRVQASRGIPLSKGRKATGAAVAE